MSLRFSIPREEVERYRRLRARSREFNQQIVKTAPRVAIERMGKALGIFHKNTLLLDTEDVVCVLMDCCMYDWIEDGKSLVEKYAEAHPQIGGSDEDCLLQAYLRARFRLLALESAVPGAGFFCHDVLSNQTLFLMDIALSQSMQGERGLFASRTVPLGDYWMTTGAGLPVDRNSGELIIRMLGEEKLLEDRSPAGPHRLALAILRACLDCGAAEYVRYQGSQEGGRPLGTGHFGARPSRHAVGRNDPCPCGSGKKHKHCCLAK